jgi:DNA-binding response OmpR family regulator
MPRKILMFDDEPDLIEIMHARLGAEGYEIISAGDGIEGLKKVETEKPDLILLDVMMPKMHGLDVLRKLKESLKTSSIPVIMLTAKDDTESILKAKSLGAKDYITKPFNAEMLLDSVKKHLESTEKI